MDKDNQVIPPEIEELAESFDDGYFNYRIIEKEIQWADVEGENHIEYYYELYEVYYNSKNEIIAWTENPVPLCFEEDSDIDTVIIHINEARKKKILKLLREDSDNEELIELDKYMRDIKL